MHVDSRRKRDLSKHNKRNTGQSKHSERKQDLSSLLRGEYEDALLSPRLILGIGNRRVLGTVLSVVQQIRPWKAETASLGFVPGLDGYWDCRWAEYCQHTGSAIQESRNLRQVVAAI